MNKWNKPVREVSAEFLENEQRRKQMIIEAAKRRREKEQRLQMQEQQSRKNEEEALIRHKQNKKDAYVKYLRSNLHDKYEQQKKQQKEMHPEPPSAGKWKKKNDKNTQLEALDLEIRIGKSDESKQDQVVETRPLRNKLIEEFEQDWQENGEGSNEMLGSKLLDSLDLDIGTIHRENALKQLIKEQQTLRRDEETLQQIRDIIGYESIVMTKNTENIMPQSRDTKTKVKGKQIQMNEVEIFNELRNKKEGKLLHWAIQEDQEAEDLFSNCSVKKIKEEPQSVGRLWEKKGVVSGKIQGKLEPIKERAKDFKLENNKKSLISKKGEAEVKQKHGEIYSKAQSIEKLKSWDKNEKNNVQQQFAPISKPSFQIKQSQPIQKRTVRTKSKEETQLKEQKQKVKQITNCQPKPLTENQKKKSTVQQKGSTSIPTNVKPAVQTVASREYQITLATQEQRFQVDQFIQNQLVFLNHDQIRLQQQLKEIHQSSKNKVRAVVDKYQIKTNYQHSADLLKLNVLFEQHQNEEGPKQSEDALQQSLQRLDDMLMRRDLQIRERDRVPDPNQKRFFINPLSSPMELHHQVLQLAANLSRLEKAQADPEGYGYLNKIHKIKKIMPQEQEQLEESKELEAESILQRPPAMNYETSSRPFAKKDQPSQAFERIEVNEKLKKLLLDD